ncbi:11228_t:CDS:2 [Funneliformis caledonium]|uniref:11228_t:CDS:1 n=1 Tax=Funneliformis caledonium TaxID=1117310 RepID=A0A9N9HDZ8_9GLOM|nr:11228_t:CDS:2 [Funneliformis caledonium]
MKRSKKENSSDSLPEHILPIKNSENVQASSRSMSFLALSAHYISNIHGDRYHYDVCDKGFALKKILNKHKKSNTHDKMLDRERKAKNLPFDLGFDVEVFHDYDEGNEDNSISLTLNNITAFNKKIENLDPDDEDNDVGYSTP